MKAMRLLVVALLAVFVGACGGGAEAEVERGLDHLRAGEHEAAVEAVDRAAEQDDGFAPLRDFVHGNAAFARCEAAEEQARAPGSEPFAFDIAIRHAEDARRAWESAAASRADWPEARRNVERAIYKLDDLRLAKADAERSRQKEKVRNPRVRPRPLPKPADGEGDGDPTKGPKPPDPASKGEGEEPAPDTSPQLIELPPDQVLTLLETLRRKEQEKMATRRARRRERNMDVERDW